MDLIIRGRLINEMQNKYIKTFLLNQRQKRISLFCLNLHRKYSSSNGACQWRCVDNTFSEIEIIIFKGEKNVGK